MVRKIFIFAVAFICYVLLNVDCQAELVTVEVTGVVDSISEEGGIETDGSVAVGSLMQGWCVYDTETPDEYADEYSGKYALVGMSMEIGDYVFMDKPVGGNSYFTVGVVDPTYTARSGAAFFDGTIYVDGSTSTYEDIEWAYGGMTLIDVWTSSDGIIENDALPTTFPSDISIFDMRCGFSVGFRQYVDPADGSFGFSGELTSIRVIPEPVSVLLLGVGGLAVFRRRRRQEIQN